MKVHFEKIGRNNKTFDVELPTSVNPTLNALVDEYCFLERNVRGCVFSQPDFDISEDGKKIIVFAGFRRVGEVWLVDDTKNGGKRGK